MSYLVDTNVLLRWPRPSDPLHVVARGAVDVLLGTGERLYVASQNLIEFRCVATRPVKVTAGNGARRGG